MQRNQKVTATITIHDLTVRRRLRGGRVGGGMTFKDEFKNEVFENLPLI